MACVPIAVLASTARTALALPEHISQLLTVCGRQLSPGKQHGNLKITVSMGVGSLLCTFRA